MCIMLTSAATAAACACEHGIFVRTMHRLSQAAGPRALGLNNTMKPDLHLQVVAIA
jgi:hypothetical protein